jgi:hypothetical protein
VQCTKALGGPFSSTVPQCSFYCVPNCGSADLRQGQTGHTSGPGTITLRCSGQTPLECSLRVDVP